ncbi:ROK family transcriptional regulator [Paenibacillus koleovorans]|uniref:ROK family transcriptional regulator n=1 Tax=Paenibacillus koleovorans TaxID=121608 RepID=UPI001FE8D3CA|nr:ROK family protein [Paenibacillus koleovorans]
MNDQKGSKLKIIQTIRMMGKVSRINLTRLTGLSRATISLSIAELIQMNIVQETTERYSTGGRPATFLELVPNSCYVLGADFANRAWTLAAFDPTGEVHRKITIPVANPTAEETIQTLLEEIIPFARQLDKPPVPLLGIGAPGLVDADHSTIRSVPELGWNNINLGTIVSKKIGWTSVIINRHRARGLAECRYGSGQQYTNQIYIGIGSGIAAGIYIDRRLLPGTRGGAGEIAHSTVEPDGPLCPCGNNGCLHVLSSASAIEQEFRKHVRSRGINYSKQDRNYDLQLVRATDICLAAEQGDESAAAVIRMAASYLGIVMANLVNLINPEAIILGGSIPNSSPLFVQTATEVMHRRAMHSLAAGTEVKVNKLKEIGGALGAANFALDEKAEISMFGP